MLRGGVVPEIVHDAECVTQNEYYPWHHRLVMQSLLDNHVVLYVGSGIWRSMTHASYEWISSLRRMWIS